MPNSLTNTIWHAIEPVQVLKELNTDIHRGLTEDEVKSRLEKYGYNELKKEEKVSPFILFINQFKNILTSSSLSLLCSQRSLEKWSMR